MCWQGPKRFLPAETCKTYIKEAEKGDDKKMRVISDYVSGMTGEYATRLYENIFVPRKGSILTDSDVPSVHSKL
ncbi:hypothetical protein ACE3YX_005157 [Salmonella enterica]